MTAKPEVPLTTLAYILSSLSLLMSILLLFHLRSPFGWLLLFPKLAASSLSPLWFFSGTGGAVLGLLVHNSPTVLIGGLGTIVTARYILICFRLRGQAEKKLSRGESEQSPSQPGKKMRHKNRAGFFWMGTPENIAWERDVPFWDVPETGEELLCDIWRPRSGKASGLAVIYFHGSGWWAGDKDFMTRPFFRHLAAQGHTVIDVAYRLCPKVDIHGMVADVKRSIGWLKKNAADYDVNPDKIVLCGGSAGAHLALLAAYTADNRELRPVDLRDGDLSVCGVISWYGPTNMRVTYEHTRQSVLTDRPSVSIGADSQRRLRDIGRMDTLLGGQPEEVPAIYRLASPSDHIHPGCPPTLLLQGGQDIVVPAESTEDLADRLAQAGVPGICIIYPWTPHGFDLFCPRISPPAQSALQNVDSFLWFLAGQK